MLIAWVFDLVDLGGVVKGDEGGPHFAYSFWHEVQKPVVSSIFNSTTQMAHWNTIARVNGSSSPVIWGAEASSSLAHVGSERGSEVGSWMWNRVCVTD